MMRAYAVGLVLAASFASGCAMRSADTTEPPRELEPVVNTVAVTRAWSVGLGGAVDIRVGLSPVVYGERVFAAGYGGRVVAVNTGTGRVLWQRELEVNLAGGPGVGDDLVAVTTVDGEVIALDAQSGSQRWRVTASSIALGVPGVSRSVVAVRTNDGMLIGLDALSGDRLWAVHQPVPSLTLRGTSGVLSLGDLMIAGFDNGRVMAVLARDGQTAWEISLGVASGRTEVERMVDVTATPRALGRDVYAVAYQGRLAGLASESGRVLWSQEFSSTAGLDATGIGVWVTDADSEVWGFNPLSGTQLWHQPGLRARHVTAPAAGPGWVAVADFEGWIHILDAESGRFVARVRGDTAGTHTAPVTVGALLIIQGAGGTLTAYRVGE